MSVEGLDQSISTAEGSGSEPASAKAVETLHLAGSSIVTGGVAALLALIAIPVSIGLGAAWGARAVARRLRGKQG
jgi:hypothetical protein